MPAGGTPSHQALAGGNLESHPGRMSQRGPLFYSRGAGTKVHSLATGCGQRGSGQRCYHPCLAPSQRQAPIRAMPSHTAKAGLTEVGSEHPVGVASGDLAGRPAHLRFGLQAGWPLGPTLAAVAVDSAPEPPGSGFRRLNRATGWVLKLKHMYIYIYMLYIRVHL